MTSKPESKNYASAASKASTKENSALWELPDGRKFTAQEMAQLKWETRIELLLYKMLKKST